MTPLTGRLGRPPGGGLAGLASGQSDQAKTTVRFP